ncbi:MAG: 50S ribosomal protein L13 [Candidatus Omnitrophota bacterium]|nr:MAG: 50S ribosomal protein L13 [Candidatus Omnitrophota bacterium]
MQKTYFPKKEDFLQKWLLVDVEGKILGRAASKIAAILRGKHKRLFTPGLDLGDNVIVINAAKIKVTGSKASQKVYLRYSGYQGGQKEVSFTNMRDKKPATVVRLAIQRMLPGGPLGRKLIKKLKVYPGQSHPHAGQKPEVLKV